LPKENTLEDEAVNEEVLVAILNVLEQAKQDPTLVSSFSMNDVRSRLPRAARNPSTDAYLDPSPQLLEWAKERLVEVLSGEEPTK
jgi:nucleoid DNA-binding protein